MKLSLSENICSLRKSKHMTQEQLADALGVTFASVSKWERGVSIPELDMLVQMAGIFEVSIDALIGFNILSDSITAIEERIHDLQKEKKYVEAMDEAEKALLRYPNDFRIVYRSGELYSLAGIEEKENRYLKRGIELLNQSISLLSQNTDPKINEFSIQSQIAQSYLRLGQIDTGLQILKQNNANGVHNSLIAYIYATDMQPFDSKKVEPYLIGAFTDLVTSSIRTMMAYANYYEKKGDPVAGLDSLLWLINLMQNIKIKPETVSFLDKVIAASYAKCAALSFMIGDEGMIGSYLHKALGIAKVFDSNPTYNLENIKFCVGDIEEARSYDDLGKSAIESIEEQLSEENGKDMLIRMWKQIIKEEEEGN